MRPFLGVLATVAIMVANGCALPVREVSARLPAVNAPYRLASGDRLRVIVFGQDNLSNSFSVDGAGDIAMPLIGRVRAQGLTAAELEHAIEARLRQGYLREPSVSAEVEAFRPFFVLGEVAHPGAYPVRGSMNVLQALALSGGPTEYANRGSIVVIRHGNDGKESRYHVNYRQIISGKAQAIQLVPGDTVFVP